MIKETSAQVGNKQIGIKLMRRKRKLHALLFIVLLCASFAVPSQCLASMEGDVKLSVDGIPGTDVLPEGDVDGVNDDVCYICVGNDLGLTADVVPTQPPGGSYTWSLSGTSTATVSPLYGDTSVFTAGSAVGTNTVTVNYNYMFTNDDQSQIIEVETDVSGLSLTADKYIVLSGEDVEVTISIPNWTKPVVTRIDISGPTGLSDTSPSPPIAGEQTFTISTTPDETGLITVEVDVKQGDTTNTATLELMVCKAWIEANSPTNPCLESSSFDYDCKYAPTVASGGITWYYWVRSLNCKTLATDPYACSCSSGHNATIGGPNSATDDNWTGTWNHSGVHEVRCNVTLTYTLNGVTRNRIVSLMLSQEVQPEIEVTSVAATSPSASGAWPYDPVWDDTDLPVAEYVSVKGEKQDECSTNVDQAAVSYELNKDVDAVTVKLWVDDWGTNTVLDTVTVGAQTRGTHTVIWYIDNEDVETDYYFTVEADGGVNSSDNDDEKSPDYNIVREEFHSIPSSYNIAPDKNVMLWGNNPTSITVPDEDTFTALPAIKGILAAGATAFVWSFVPYGSVIDLLFWGTVNFIQDNQDPNPFPTVYDEVYEFDVACQHNFWSSYNKSYLGNTWTLHMVVTYNYGRCFLVEGEEDDEHLVLDASGAAQWQIHGGASFPNSTKTILTMPWFATYNSYQKLFWQENAELAVLPKDSGTAAYPLDSYCFGLKINRNTINWN